MFKLEIGENIRKYRQLRGMTQTDLALKMSTTKQCISSWENNRTQPDIDAVTQLAQILYCSEGDIMGGSAGQVSIAFIEEKMQDLDANSLNRLIKFAEYLISKRN